MKLGFLLVADCTKTSSQLVGNQTLFWRQKFAVGQLWELFYWDLLFRYKADFKCNDHAALALL